MGAKLKKHFALSPLEKVARDARAQRLSREQLIADNARARRRQNTEEINALLAKLRRMRKALEEWLIAERKREALAKGLAEAKARHSQRVEAAAKRKAEIEAARIAAENKAAE